MKQLVLWWSKNYFKVWTIVVTIFFTTTFTIATIFGSLFAATIGHLIVFIFFTAIILWLEWDRITKWAKQ